MHQNQGKLKSEAVRYMFLGFTKGVKGYRFWHSIENQCLKSRGDFKGTYISLMLLQLRWSPVLTQNLTFQMNKLKAQMLKISKKVIVEKQSELRSYSSARDRQKKSHNFSYQAC